MIFDLEELNPATMFFFDDDDESKGGVELRVLNKDALDNINKKCIKKKVEYKKSQRYEFQEVNEKLHTEMMVDYTITGWAGLKDKAGTEIPCTLENKVKLMNGSTFFTQFYSAKMEILNQAIAEQGEALTKN
jgi:hypothetical protein